MAAARRLIVGLGNPLPQYEGTRHNVGFDVADRLVRSTPYIHDGRAQALVADVRWKGRAMIVAKPLTFMNHSGLAMRVLARRYALTPECILVIMDDLNLPLGMVRVRARGSAGGHNGLQNIIDAMQSEAVTRIRIGIGGEFARGHQSRYVLSPFTPEEIPVVSEAVRQAALAARVYVTDGVTAAMNRFNRKRSAQVPARKVAT